MENTITASTTRAPPASTATADTTAVTGGFSLRLHVSILCIFISLFVVITGSMMYFLYSRLSETLLLARGELFAQVASRAVDRIDRTLRPLESIVELTARLESLAQDRGAADFHLRDVFIDAQRRYPQLSSLYIGYANGEFARVIAINDDAQIRSRIHAPPRAAHALQVLVNLEDKKGESWTFYDAAGKVIERIARGAPVYDPRVRPWYQPALDANTVIKTPPYIFAATGEAGFTLARKAMYLKGAVIGADVRLAEMSAHLTALRPTRMSDIALFNASGDLLIHDDVEKSLDRKPTQDGVTLAPVKISQTNNAVWRALFAATENHVRPGTVAFAANGVPYHSHIEKLTLQSSRNEYVAVVAPRSDLLGQAEKIRDRALLISLALLLMTIPIIAFVAWRIARPLRELAREAHHIQRFELDGDVNVTSHITEVRRLTRSMSAMKSGLRDFARYVPRSLVRDIVAGEISANTGGKRRIITLLVSDISNFTRLSENRPPEALMAQMSEYFSALSREISTQGGTIDKFMGDAVMAFWNAPRTQDDHVLRACHTALALRRATARLNHGWLAASDVPALPTRFGLHTGEAIVGSIGSDDRLSYTALGTVVNTVFRIEQLNRVYGTEILMTDAIAAQCGKTFITRPVDRVIPRGASASTLIHELMGQYDHSDKHDTRQRLPLIDLAHSWQPAWMALQKQDWPLALHLFQDLVNRFPDDKLSQIYLTRVTRHLNNPGHQDWDGIDRRV